MFPDVDDEDLTRRERKQRTLALKILILASLAAISSLHVHNQDVIRHTRRCISFALFLILRQPNTLGGLSSLHLRHHGELSAEQLIEKGGLSGGLRTEHRDEMVIETSRGDILKRQIFGQVGAIQMRSAF